MQILCDICELHKRHLVACKFRESRFLHSSVFKYGPFPASFSFIFVFSNKVNSKQMFYNKFASVWIWTAHLWYQKRMLCQLSHNHCPNDLKIFLCLFFRWIAQIWNLEPQINVEKSNLEVIFCLKSKSCKRHGQISLENTFPAFNFKLFA